MKYLNFDLEAFQYQKNGTKESFRVRVADSPAGEQRMSEAEDVSLPDDLRLRLGFLENQDLNTQELIELGINLGDVLLPARARGLLYRSLERLTDDQGLRIRLKLDTYALADLPWEFCYLPDPNTPAAQRGLEGFLVLDRRLSLVRYEMLSQGLARLEGGPDTLRMAVLFANPSNPSFPPLDLASEQQVIEQALKGISQINAQFYPNATVDTLHDAVISGAHVFHFAGHGSFEAEMGASYGSNEGSGFIILVGDDGNERLFSAERLALSLKGREVRLVVLGACEGGRRDGVNAWTGVAPALTRAGIPAVVGMQYKIADTSAIAFSRNFYRALAAHQSIDEAVTAGRLAILTRSSEENEFDWAVPVLYLRADEEKGILFPALTRSQPMATEETPTVGRFNEAMRRLMEKTFTLDDLKTLCSDREINYANIPGDTVRAKARGILEEFRRAGNLADLVDYCRQERPNEDWPEPPHGVKVANAFTALTEMLEQDVDLSNAVNRFKDTFEDANYQIDVVNFYKCLHDQLHTLQVKCYDPLINELKRTQDINRESILKYVDDFRLIVEQLNAIISKLNIETYDSGWITKLSQAQVLMKIGANPEEFDLGQIVKAAEETNNILSVHPTAINSRLMGAVDGLKLQRLKDAMGKVAQQIARFNVDQEKVKGFITGIDSLDNLNKRLIKLTREHNRWQDADRVLRRVDEQMEKGISELERAWPGLQPQITEIYAESGEEWAVLLRLESDKLNKALQAQPQVMEDITRRFDVYRQQAVQRFYTVDKLLLSLCSELGEMGKRLTPLLEKM